MDIDLTFVLDRSSSGSGTNYMISTEMNNMLRHFGGRSSGAYVSAPEHSFFGGKETSSVLTFITFNHECTNEDVVFEARRIKEIGRDNFKYFFDGATNPAAGINRALDLAEQRRIMREHNKETFMPAVIIMFSDGYPDAGSKNGMGYNLTRQKNVIMKAYAMTAERIKTLEQTGNVLFFVIPVASTGKTPYFDLLKKLTSYEDRILKGSFSDNIQIIDSAINKNMAKPDYKCHPLDRFR